ncbi:MAG TPA: sodium/solute symporter [bacterium]
MTKLWFMDYAVMTIHLFLMAGIGFFFYKYIKNANDFFKSSNRLPWGVAGLSCFMSNFSAWTFTGGAGFIYINGISGAAILWGTSVAVLFAYFFLAHRWRRSRVMTITEFLAERYNGVVHQFYSWIYLIMKWFIVGLQLLAMNIFISVAVGLDLKLLIILTGIVLLIYTVLAGLWGVAISDVLQFIILVPVTIVAVPLSLRATGGITNLIKNVPDGYFSFGYGEASIFFIIGWTLLMLFGNNSNATVQRYFSVRDEKAAKKVALITAVLYFFGVFMWMIPSMAARVVAPDLAGMFAGQMKNGAEASYVYMCIKVLPHGMIGILLGAIFAATMSSLDSSYNVMAAIMVKDIYNKFINPKASPQRLLLVGRIFTIILGISTIALALYMIRHEGGVFGVMKDISQVLTVPIGSALILGLLIRKTPAWTALFTFAITFPVAYVTRYVYNLHLGYQACIVVGTAVLSFWITKIFWNKTAKKDRNQIEGFFNKLDTPIDVAKELSEKVATDTLSVLRVVGVLTLCVGLMVTVPVFFLQKQISIYITLCTGGALLLAGLFMIFKGKRAAYTTI